MDWTQILGPGGGLLGLLGLVLSIVVALDNRKHATVGDFDKLCTALKDRLAVVEKELQALRAENTQLKARVKELEDERDALKQKIEALQRRRATRPRKVA